MGDNFRNIKLTIAYCGKNFAGWQVQENDKTVQGEIEKALSIIHKSDIKITGAGRTDSGVHARAQTANFKTTLDSLPSENFSLALNRLLPDDIRILESREVALSFNSRYDAVKRVYKYYLIDKRNLAPWERNMAMYINKPLDINMLNSFASIIEGSHDFSSFSSPMGQGVSMIREIFSSVFYPEYPFIVYKIAGSGFLRKMVRSITGTIISLYTSGGSPEDFKEILQSRDRTKAGTTAPAHGLFLDSVHYTRDTCL
ncbi:MAG: tRNA pseudouridine(38-40) synthase TruA [Spirochaetia bacterium]|jgi:tRNA pseudouridine38-40 synthase|nr:tRNA pseudouridine(38-40) synthase TruA [Spirochaetia bacterium]